MHPLLFAAFTLNVLRNPQHLEYNNNNKKRPCHTKSLEISVNMNDIETGVM